MGILNCNFVAKSPILAHSSLPNDSSPSLPPRPRTTLKPNANPIENDNKNHRILKQKRWILEMERAIGAGIFRDRDIDRESKEKMGLFDSVLRNSVGRNEGSMEKKLRESSEWLVEETERKSRSAGKQILMAMFVWAIPLWIFAFLIASGILTLPFSIPFLQDQIS